METIVLLILLGGGGLIVWGFIAFIRGIGQALVEPPATSGEFSSSPSDEIDGMNNGDYYNGPHGYSPITGYPETQYGSGFDEDTEWHEEH